MDLMRYFKYPIFLQLNNSGESVEVKPMNSLSRARVKLADSGSNKPNKPTSCSVPTCTFTTTIKFTTTD